MFKLKTKLLSTTILQNKKAGIKKRLLEIWNIPKWYQIFIENL